MLRNPQKLHFFLCCALRPGVACLHVCMYADNANVHFLALLFIVCVCVCVCVCVYLCQREAEKRNKRQQRREGDFPDVGTDRHNFLSISRSVTISPPITVPHYYHFTRCLFVLFCWPSERNRNYCSMQQPNPSGDTPGSVISFVNNLLIMPLMPLLFPAWGGIIRSALGA